MKKQIKNIEASAKSRFGQPSEMDREIKKWTEKGWVLVNTILGKRNKYLLTFEYEPTEEESRKQRANSQTGCIVLVAIILIVGAASLYNSSQQSQNAPVTQTAQAVAFAQEATISTVNTILKSTQEAVVRATSNAIATLTTFTPTPLPSSTPIPSNTPLPTSTPLPSNTPIPTQAPFGTRDNPYVGFGAIRDGRFKVNSIQRNMTVSVEGMNMFNTIPSPGEEYVIANVTFACDLSSDQTCNTSAIFFELVGKNGNIYDTEPMTVIDKAFGGEVFGGGQVTGNVAYIIDSSDNNLEVSINDLGSRTYFRAP